MALVATLVIGVGAGVISYFTNQFNTSTLLDRVNMGIESDLAAFRDWQEIAPLLDVTNVIDRLQKNHPRSFYSYQSAGGEYLYGNLHPEDSAIIPFEGNLELIKLSQEQVHTSEGFEGLHRFAVGYHRMEDGSVLVVGRDIEHLLVQRKRMQQLGLLTIVFMMVVVAVSFYFSTYFAEVINSIGSTASDIIETGDFSRRIPVQGTWDDLSNLANLLNALLARTESLMSSVSQVSDNIAHDLRTPLTRLRNHLDELHTRLSASDDHASREISEAVIREADQILETFSALLRIARIESGSGEHNFQSLALKPLLEDILDLYQPLAEEHGVQVSAELQSLQVAGDTDMLFQLFANLMDNAVKFSPEGGTIEVRCYPRGDRIMVEIADSGKGIAPEDRERVFDRFYRAEKSRSTAGSGLGLSLVRAIVNLHQSRISILDNNPGSRCVVELHPCPEHDQTWDTV